MYKKLNNKEWEEAINLYYKENRDISIKEYCTKNNLNKSQFKWPKNLEEALKVNKEELKWILKG